MADLSKKIPYLNFRLITLLILLSISSADLFDQELDVAISALRSHGYTLFPNAIVTSDLRPRLLSTENASFTLFSPPDYLLFPLDLYSTAPHYIISLARHVSPIRLSASDLRRLPLSRLPTLLPHRYLSIERNSTLSDGAVLDSITLDGVRISRPDLFLGSRIAVHGLDGILDSSAGLDAEDYDYWGALWFSAPPTSYDSLSPARLPPEESLSPDMVDTDPRVKEDGNHFPFHRNQGGNANGPAGGPVGAANGRFWNYNLDDAF
ncbi:fasciclin-like arabinogalactan protein 19 [Tripterygium wilfordii]|uniref:fasciclin-like arabinogalactan protein 19 n=1 Tax=Tripterygium wilfordii TaxID=458696 RepID=UPI0018F83DB7|nr:fasciclin-like arabinogalactan protein 19 [Tripterygium wilfordii]